MDESIASAIRGIIAENPDAAPLFRGLDVIWATPGEVGKNYAEYYPANEPGPPGKPNPYKGTDTVAVNRDRAISPEILKEIILGDAMHRLPKTYPSLYRQFVDNPSDGYSKEMHNRYNTEGDKRSYDTWLSQSGHDSMIRGGVLGDMPSHKSEGWGRLLSNFPFSKEQFMSIKDIKRRLR